MKHKAFSLHFLLYAIKSVMRKMCPASCIMPRAEIDLRLALLSGKLILDRALIRYRLSSGNNAYAMHSSQSKYACVWAI